MAVKFSTKYPKEVTNTTWQKSKSFKDKTHKVTKTGLGDLLKRAEAAWKLVPFDQLDARKLTPASLDEAKENLERARQVKKNQLQTAYQAIVAAMKKARDTAESTALSPKAAAEADKIATSLNFLSSSLLYLELDDLELEVARFQAAKTGGDPLVKIGLKLTSGGRLGRAAKGVLNPDRSVTLSGLTWEPTAGDPNALLRTKVTIEASRADGSAYLNDIALVTLSNDLKKATFK